ncbi:DCP2 decapping enzyme homolog (S. cerevisiae), isoform CRA_b [Homo sapiens]|uniref:DCP2 decapping enzyme homolog (S. cerevisiae), isoform CRA_b n=1 Tax=Homo sapiens TaxID=9606 RepID=A0A6Q8PGI4_HUMAN|nr:DCP2 decapping enzyme homolog (S. cerevisiae), isoform CRA_b [Homo sapiens]
METKRVEIPGSVLDDLCRDRVLHHCPGMIIAHCNFQLLDSSYPLGSAS